MLVFLAIATVGFLWLAMSLVFGHDHEVEHEVGHDIDHADHDIGHDAPIVSFFSSKVFATLIMGFGAAGAIACYEGENWLSASLWGIGSGLILSLVMYGMMCMLYSQQASSLIPTSSTVGKQGEVTVSIGDNATGEVGLTVNESYITYAARSADGKSIPRGQIVAVNEVVGSTLIVRPLHPSA